MSQGVNNNTLIAKNASMLYVRMFISMAIQFFTSRVVLQALGVEDYGLYNLVGGIIVLVNMLSGSLSSATSRYITVALGEGNFEKLSKTFSTALIIHLALSGIFFLVAETVGLWFVNTMLVIPPDRLIAANWVYQVAVCSTVLGITQSPYNATINSHENFKIYAYIDILSSFLKLLIALIVLWNDSVDNLILYSLFYECVSIGIMLFYRRYCVVHYPETKFKFVIDRTLFPNMLAYSGWNLFSSISLTACQQGTNVLYNWFLGNAIIAAAGIASMVQGTLNTFATNIMAAFNPQLIKEYAKKNYIRVNELIVMGGKITSFMTLIISIPVFVKMHFLMSLWLDKIPEGAVVICQILLVRNFFNNFNPLTYTAITASGKVKWVNILCGAMYLLSLPISYAILYFTRSYVLLYIAGIVTGAFSTCFIYILILKRQMNDFKITDYLFKTILPMFLIGLLVLGACLFLDSLIENNYISLFTIVVFSTSLIILLSFYAVFDKHTRATALNMVQRKLHVRF
jgi:polysaccharide biosynthesis protein